MWSRSVIKSLSINWRIKTLTLAAATGMDDFVKHLFQLSARKCRANNTFCFWSHACLFILSNKGPCLIWWGVPLILKPPIQSFQKGSSSRHHLLIITTAAAKPHLLSLPALLEHWLSKARFPPSPLSPFPRSESLFASLFPICSALLFSRRSFSLDLYF